MVWWDRPKDSADQPAYPCAAPVHAHVYIELMVPVAAGEELLVSYAFQSARSRKYAVAPPPPLSTPEEWGQHLDPVEARVLRTQRLRALRAADIAEAHTAAEAAANVVRARWLAQARAVLTGQNAAKGRAKRAAAAHKAAHMRQAKLTRREAAGADNVPLAAV